MGLGPASPIQLSGVEERSMAQARIDTDCGEAARDGERGGELLLTVSVVLVEEVTWAAARHVLAWEQRAVPDALCSEVKLRGGGAGSGQRERGGSGGSTCPPVALNEGEDAGVGLEVEEEEGSICVRGA
eukprot:1430050-Rhodomonas_salina.1